MSERANRLAVAGLGVAVGVAGFLLARGLLEPVRVDPHAVVVLDFAYYANVARAFWAGEINNPYAAADLLKAFGTSAGRDVEQAMPVGVGPSSFLLWWPLAVLAGRDLGLAHAAWVGGSLGAFVAGLGLLARDPRGRLPAAAGAVLLAGAVSVALVRTAVGGQLTLVAVPALVALWKPPGRPVDRWADGLAVGLLLVVLAVKPTYLLLGLVALGAQRRTRAGLVGLALLLVANGVALGLMDAGAAGDLVAALRMYSNGRVPPHFADTFVPATMASFTSGFGPLLGVPAAFLAARVLGAAGLLLVAGLVVWGKTPARVVFALAVGVVLLFTPYLGAYEDLLVLAVVGVLVRDGASFPRFGPGWGLLVLAAVVFFNRQATLAGLPLVAHWGLKLVLVGGLARVSVRGGQGANSRS